MIDNILGAFVVGLLVSFLVMPLIIALLKKKNLMDSPDRRKIHRGFIPSMGGIGIVVGLIVALLIWLTFNGIIESKYLLAGVGLLFVAGIRDDLIPISPRVKLIVQILAAFIVLTDGIVISSAYGLFGLDDIYYTVKIFITIGFIIFFTNSFNLIDGLDGLAGTIALIISSFFATWFYLNESYYLAVISAATAGSIIGFLYYNWKPAKIFMGDTGALSLGFLFSVLAILFLNKDSALTTEWYKFQAPISTAIAVLIIPLFDTSRIIVVRLVKKKSPFEPDNNHTHHVLIRLGLTHAQAALVLGFANLVFIGFVTIFRQHEDNILLPIIILVCFSLSVLLDQLIIHRVRTKGGKKRKKLKESIKAGKSQ
ncbi:MAG: undecaprenyl/decaprenyl-phosphate alpha-N-acetylglucosaminyl 1-phosphate transferase [Cyclobacteriaceae bacterium]|nr:undecaprenyl/decaprenyl-phosphate alpha-N-acetylglucosaminyl 1-phosphate transferase [Cyclobacteriaceae bacterium]